MMRSADEWTYAERECALECNTLIGTAIKRRSDRGPWVHRPSSEDVALKLKVNESI